MPRKPKIKRSMSQEDAIATDRMMMEDSIGDHCVICGDTATGKHYGALSCDGCKGFFRRSVRKKHVYTCRFNGSCIVDKHHRNTCRRCRYEMCIRRGMRTEAVQMERDSIVQGSDNKSPTLNDNISDSNSYGSPTVSTLDRLMEAEAELRLLRASVITKTSDAERKEATTGDVTDSMHQQLDLLVKWAKKLEVFNDLSHDVQISLLRAYAAQHLVLCASYRSTHLSDSLWLTNDTCLPKTSLTVPDVTRVAERIVDTLTVSMRRLNMRSFEYVALKGIAFFDPIACKSSSPEQITKVEEIRTQLISNLESRLSIETSSSSSIRLSSLLLILPPLVSVSRDLIEDVHLCSIFDLADIDLFMTNLLLPSSIENKPPNVHNISSHTAMQLS